MIIKKIFDKCISLLALIVLTPFMVIISLVVGKNLGRPIFFIQKRIGLNNNEFKMIKFRTMKESKDRDGKVLTDSDRLTSIGRTLRSLSFDELPELLNVLKGDMSLVGPRPLLVEYLPNYSKEQLRRHEVVPGITGWAQINGRNSISWSEKFKLDVWYVDNWTIWLDIKILFLTLKKVVIKEGINQDDNVTMEYFNGRN